MNRPPRPIPMIVCIALVASACSGSDDGITNSLVGDVRAGALADGASGGTDFAPPGQRPGEGDVAQTPSTGADGAPTGVNAPAPEQPECTDPGSLLCPCATNDDCDSGWCVEGPEGFVCSKECISDCPTGYACRQLAGIEGDPVFVCVFPYARLCLPCAADSDCSGSGGGLSDRCVDRGSLGQSCGVACSDQIPCPEGYACAQIETVGGEPAVQCVPSERDCPCTDGLDETEMLCSDAPFGVDCPGTRTCLAGEWTLCDAVTPPAETCDGVDNDCDGEVDEDLGRLDCGLGACHVEVDICIDGALHTCEDVTPQPTDETCNLIDDDCDNRVDEELGTVECGLGVCAQVLEACVAGDLVICDPFAGRGTETCDGLDNDCDGLADQHWPEVGETCDGVDEDLCEDGEWQCRADGLGVICAGDDEPKEEICNGLDDDCDGDIDEVEALGTTTCGLGVCLKTIDNCQDGGDVSCDALAEAADTDLPDRQLLDEDCDGIDGEADNAIFVDGTTGSDDNPGTMEAPKRTIQAGIDAAQNDGKRDVYVSSGFYGGSLTLRNGVNVFGLFSASSGWARDPGNTVTVSGGATAILAEGITDSTIIDGLVVNAADAKITGTSSYALRAKDSAGLIVRGSTLSAGLGAHGRDGVDGQTGNDGQNGRNGLAGCEYGCMSPAASLDYALLCIAGALLIPDSLCWACCLEPLVSNPVVDVSCNRNSCQRPVGGNGGNNSSCEAGGGIGGEGALSGDRGTDGDDGRGGAEGGNGGGPTVEGNGGRPGEAGATGSDGAAGSSMVVGDEGLEPMHGAHGASGEHGGGGAGGGGGGGDAPYCPAAPSVVEDPSSAFDISACTTYGSSGGGGGAGGCGGGAGTGGETGGGSIAVYLWASSITIEGVTTVTAGGGDGGKGGRGMAGGLGGDGGLGGPKGDLSETAAVGGPGGKGGKGGVGGHGGGGSGGPSVGVLCAGGSEPNLVDVGTDTVGPGGRGGVSEGAEGTAGISVGRQGCPTEAQQ